MNVNERMSRTLYLVRRNGMFYLHLVPEARGRGGVVRRARIRDEQARAAQQREPEPLQRARGAAARAPRQLRHHAHRALSEAEPTVIPLLSQPAQAWLPLNEPQDCNTPSHIHPSTVWKSRS